MFGLFKRAPTIIVVSAEVWDEIAAAVPGRLDAEARIDGTGILLARGPERVVEAPYDPLAEHRRRVISGNSRA